MVFDLPIHWYRKKSWSPEDTDYRGASHLVIDTRDKSLCGQFTLTTRAVRGNYNRCEKCAQIFHAKMLRILAMTD